MNIFLKEHLELIQCLNDNQVEFMLIGGYSVIYYGYPRTTADLDIWIKPDNENKTRLLNALSSLGFSPEELEDLNKMDFTKHLVFSIGDIPEKTDFITKINLVEFESAYKQKITEVFEGVEVPIIHLNDLILSKLNTGREKDKVDIEELQKLKK